MNHIQPLWDDLGFVTDPCTRSLMSHEHYSQYQKQPQYEKTRKYLNQLATNPEKVGLISPIFQTYKDFGQTWVACSMLLHAVEAGCIAAAQKLLELGVARNKISTFFTQYWNGQLALNMAVKRRNLAMVKVLLDAGVDPNRYDRDNSEGTALMVALESYFLDEDTTIDTDIINVLLAHKALPEGTDLFLTKWIKYNSLPQEAIARHQKYEYWEHKRRLRYGKDIYARSAAELAQKLCLDNWVKEFEKYKHS